MARRPMIQKKSIIELIECGEKDKASFSAEEYYNELKNLTEKCRELSLVVSMKNNIISSMEKGLKYINTGLSILKNPEEFEKRKTEKKKQKENNEA